ncbi:MAG: hypothetical protein IAX21_06525 [Candidatus Bathyarchaeota archaeon]|nr:MAG: hypothetical protein IAX21_06525 [Candidatus Bathyarchaeota archaeon]
MTKTAKCKFCGDDVTLPFKCKYCGDSFCGDHRIPESHNCPEAWRAKAPRETPPIVGKQWSAQPKYKYTVSYAPQNSRVFWFSKKELQHLLLGTLLVMAVGLSFFLNTSSSTIIIVGLTIAFTLSFLLHEIAHKFSAQHFNMWAEFRLTLQGALITLLSAFLPPPFKIISPGAVMIAGSGNLETIGKVAVSGPITNIGLSVICAFIAAVTNQGLFWVVAFINAFLATFNLIPFGIIDGMKIYKWNKLVWATVFAVAVGLMALTYSTLY